MGLAQEPQRSDADEARTRGPSVSSQAQVYVGFDPERLIEMISLRHCL